MATKENVIDSMMSQVTKCKNSGLCNGVLQTDKMAEMENHLGIPMKGNPKKCPNCNM